MKKTDIAMIILIASVSIMVAYFVANSLPLFKDAQKPVTVKVAEPITPTIEKVDKTVFNKNALNPTVEVIIGGNQPVISGSTDDATNQETAN